MERNFEQRLDTYSNVAKLDIAGKLQEKNYETLAASLRDFARERGSSPDMQEAIYNYEIQKEQVRQQLAAEIEQLNKGELSLESEPTARNVEYQNGQLVTKGEDATPTVLTLGTLLTDGAWGIKYNLDSHSVAKEIIIQYLTAEAERRIDDLTEQQIYLYETETRFGDTYKKETYETVLEERDAGIERDGLVFEKMVFNLFQKLKIDHQLPFHINKGDLYDDIEWKIDMIVERDDYNRGVRIEDSTDESLNSVGIQFTLNASEDNLAKKRHQIDSAKRRLSPEQKINDYLLIAVAPEYGRGIKQAYNAWKDQNKPSGGPDEWWDDDTKHFIFEHMLQTMYSQDEIKAMWREVTAH